MFVVFAHQPTSSRNACLSPISVRKESKIELVVWSVNVWSSAYLFKHFIQNSNFKLRVRARHFYTASQQPDNSSFDGQWQTSKCINSFLDSDVKKRVKNKLCFILCQDKTFEDKMNYQFQRVSYGHSTHCKCLTFNLWKLVISTINIKQT
jgi:Pyruvate/2-oxoacid:ferredoxin oxidoreductase delta subunit